MKNFIFAAWSKKYGLFYALVLLPLFSIFAQIGEHHYNLYPSKIDAAWAKMNFEDDVVDSSECSLNHVFLQHKKGNAFYQNKDYENALLCFEECLETYRENYEFLFSYYANVCYSMGIIYFRIGDVDKGLEYLMRSHNIYVNDYSGYFPEIDASFYTDMCVIYTQQGNYKEKLKLFLQGVIKHKDKFSYISIGTPISLLNISYSHKENGRPDKALEFQLKSFLLELIFLDNYHLKPESESNPFQMPNGGEDYFKHALGFYMQSLNLRKSIYGLHHPYVASCLNNIGLVYLSYSQPEKALKYFKEAIVANVANVDVLKNIQVEGLENNILDEFILIKSLEYNAATLSLLCEGRPTNEALDFYVESVRLYKIASDLIIQVRKSYRCENSKITLGEHTEEFYSDAFNTALNAFRLTRDSSLLVMAYKFLQWGKANVLMDELQDIKAKEIAEIPNDLIVKEKQLRNEFYRCLKEVYHKKSDLDSHASLLNEEAFRKADAAWTFFIQYLETKYPEYYKSKYNAAIPELKEIQDSLLSDGALLLMYHERKKNIWVFEVTKQNISVRMINKDDFLDNIIKRFVHYYANPPRDSSSLVVNDLNDFQIIGYELYQILLEPSINKYEEQVSELLLIPDGILNEVSFKLLMTEPYAIQNISSGNVNAHYTQLPYLLRKFPVNYFYSGTHALETLGMVESQPVDSLSVLAFGPYAGSCDCPDSSKEHLSHGLDLLRATEDEICCIARYFNTYYYIGNCATESIFKKESSRNEHNIIHVITHAHVSSDGYKDNLRIYFNNEYPDCGEDDILNAHEIYNLPLRADMVVLSACYSGIGREQKGEGIMSLGRAFCYAGCPSVVMTKWAVDDQTSASLMGHFYKGLAEGMSKSIALQNAEIKYLEEQRNKCNLGLLAHPYYWAGYACVGNNNPIVNPKKESCHNKKNSME